MKYNQLFSVVFGFSFFFITSSFCGKEAGVSTTPAGGRLPSSPVVSVPAVVPTAPPCDAFDDEEDEAGFGGLLPNDAAARCGAGKPSDGLNDRAVRGLCAVASVAGLVRRGPALDVCAGVAQVKCSPRGAPGFERPVVKVDTSGDEALAYTLAREEASTAARASTRHPVGVDGDDVRAPVAAPAVSVSGGAGRSLVRASASRIPVRASGVSSSYSTFRGSQDRHALASTPKEEPMFVGWSRTYSPPRRQKAVKLTPEQKRRVAEIRADGEARCREILGSMVSSSHPDAKLRERDFLIAQMDLGLFFHTELFLKIFLSLSGELEPRLIRVLQVYFEKYIDASGDPDWDKRKVLTFLLHVVDEMSVDKMFEKKMFRKQVHTHEDRRVLGAAIKRVTERVLCWGPREVVRQTTEQALASKQRKDELLGMRSEIFATVDAF